MLAADEVRRAAQVGDRAVLGGGARVLGEAAVVADGQAELEAVHPDRGAVVAGREVRGLVAVEVLLVVRHVDRAVRLHDDAGQSGDAAGGQRAAGHDDGSGLAGGVAQRLEREVDEGRQRAGEDGEVVAGEERLRQHDHLRTLVGGGTNQPGRRGDVGDEVAGHRLGLGRGDREDHWTTTSMRWNSLSSV